MGEKVNAGRIIAKMLKAEGVDCIFTLPGGHIMNIYYGCRAEGITVIDTRHEAVAAHAADAYARITGKPGVVVTTAGPGVTNATTAMVEARASGSPVIHIGGCAPQQGRDTGDLQSLNTVEIMSTVCKWSRSILEGKRAAEYVSMAFRQAMAGTPGPVYLEISSDVIGDEFDIEEVNFPTKYRAGKQAGGNPEVVLEAAELLAEAKSPLLILGDSARFSADDGGDIK